MRVWTLAIALAGMSAAAMGQMPSCSAPVWSPCDLVFPLEAGEDAAKAELRAEFRSPHRDTRAIHAFLDGGRLVLRFTPDEVGEWDYRVTSSLRRLDGQLGKASGTAANVPGFVHTINSHHFQTADLQPHLWMGSVMEGFVAMPRAEFEAAVAARAAEKFTHLRVTIGAGDDLNEAAARVRVIHDRGLITDIALAEIPVARVARERYLREIVARFAGFNITWAGVPAWERLPNARETMREVGRFIAGDDPYEHPRTTGAESTSFLLAEDGWMNFLSYGTSDANIGAVERQSARIPSVNAGIKTRADLWNATMNGHYPASGAGPEFKAWYEFFANTRYWEMEPYFDVTGGRAIAVRDVELTGDDVIDAVEYIVYLEKPGPVEIKVQKQKYDVWWFDPATGQRVKDKDKDYKGEMFAGNPPDTAHDWVLHLERTGHKEGLLKKYKFESRPVRRQTPEVDSKNLPFQVAAPLGDIPSRLPAPFRLDIVRETRATRELLVMWTAELTNGGEGGRVLGTGVEGMLRLPAVFGEHAPAVASLRVSILNANGKLYILDRVFRVVP